MSSSEIQGSCKNCIYAPMLSEAVGQQLINVIEAEEVAKTLDAFPYENIPDHVIGDVEKHLMENPCKFVHDGICSLAGYAIKELAES